LSRRAMSEFTIQFAAIDTGAFDHASPLEGSNDFATGNNIEHTTARRSKVERVDHNALLANGHPEAP
jgi:hypothetical protein